MITTYLRLECCGTHFGQRAMHGVRRRCCGLRRLQKCSLHVMRSARYVCVKPTLQCNWCTHHYDGVPLLGRPCGSTPPLLSLRPWLPNPWESGGGGSSRSVRYKCVYQIDETSSGLMRVKRPPFTASAISKFCLAAFAWSSPMFLHAGQ